MLVAFIIVVGCIVFLFVAKEIMEAFMSLLKALVPLFVISMLIIFFFAPLNRENKNDDKGQDTGIEVPIFKEEFSKSPNSDDLYMVNEPS